MKITRKGISESALFEGQCPSCRCEFVCDFAEVKYNIYNNTYTINECPECAFGPIEVKRKLIITNKDL